MALPLLAAATTDSTDYATAAQGALADAALQSVALDDVSDVAITTATSGDVLSYNGTSWVNTAAPPADISSSSIGQLSDVDTTTTTPTTNDVLTWTGTEWEPAASQGGSGITNLDYTASPTDGTVTSDTGTDATVTLADGTNAGLLAPGDFTKLAGISVGAEVNVNADWNASSGDAQILNKPTIPSDTNDLTNGAGYISNITGEDLGDLSDVTVTSATNGDVLSYNGTAWINSAAPPADISSSSIGQLNDVDTTTNTPTTNDVLTWTGSGWEPAASQGGSGITNLGYTASATDGTVTSDTGTDATVPLADATNAGLLAPGDFTKLGGIADGAEVNVNADWNAASGDAQILNKPTLGTAAATDSTDYATAAQGATADSAIQPGNNVSTLTNDAGYITDAGVTQIVAGTNVTIAPVGGTGVVTINATGGGGSGAGISPD